MITKIVAVKRDNVIIKDEDTINIIKEAGLILKRGGLVAFPTETVYGLGGDALNPRSSEKIYNAKGRPSDNPLIIHIASIEKLEQIVEIIPQKGRALANAFWPGPLTMIFHKSEIVPDETTGGLSTVAVRMPSHETAIALIEAAGGFIAAPSANLSGRPSPTVAKYVIEDMDGRIDMIIEGDAIEIGLESTIVDVTEDPPVILRPGFVTKEMLEAIIGEVKTDRTILEGTSTKAPKAPGMKYRHYAPKGEMTMIEGKPEQVIACINERAKKAKAEGKKVGVIATTENIMQYEADYIKCIGSKQNEEQIASQLYRILREFDDDGVDVILSECFSEEGMGYAIMNRLLKASGYRKIILK